MEQRQRAGRRRETTWAGNIHHEVGDDAMELGTLEVQRLAGLANALLASLIGASIN
jgi:hypothetical protein